MKPFRDMVRLLSNTESMLDFRRAINLCNLLLSVEQVPGAVVEVGCYKGHTAAMLAALTGKAVWVYDTFSGLPEPGPEDEGRRSDFRKGYLSATVKDVEDTFESAGLDFPKTVMCDIRTVTDSRVPSKIAFAHIDVDLYESTKGALDMIWLSMASGGIVVVDDYNNDALPGVSRAVDFWWSYSRHAYTIESLPMQAVIRF